MRIFIAGGTGFVGEHLTKCLLNSGHSVRLLVHSRKPVSEKIEQVVGDVTKIDTFQENLAGCDAVINLIGIIREFPSRQITFEKIHIQATENLLNATKKASVSRYIQMSALGTRVNAISGYHKSKWEGEELVRKSGIDWTIIRPSLIFGPHDAFINMLAAQLRFTPVMPIIGNGEYRLQPIHGDDVARCFTISLDDQETVGKTYQIAGKDRISYKALLDMISAALHQKPVWKPELPLNLMKIIIGFMQGIPQFPITLDQLQMLIEENICENEWQETFGFIPRGLQDGIAEYL